MKTYIINLKDAVNRREYIEQQLSQVLSLSPEFVEAVDGRKMSEAERNKSFDIERFRRRYAKEVRPGEIGCTLSHQKCYRLLSESENNYALILEDDVVLNHEMNEVLKNCDVLLNTDIPSIILLSGWYWYCKKRSFTGRYHITCVFDAFLTHAYLINQAAARLLVEDRPFILADDWKYIRKKGIQLKAILPHVVETDDSGVYPTAISNVSTVWIKSLILRRIQLYIHVICLKVFELFGHFERHIAKQ